MEKHNSSPVKCLVLITISHNQLICFIRTVCVLSEMSTNTSKGYLLQTLAHKMY